MLITRAKVLGRNRKLSIIQTVVRLKPLRIFSVTVSNWSCLLSHPCQLLASSLRLKRKCYPAAQNKCQRRAGPTCQVLRISSNFGVVAWFNLFQTFFFFLYKMDHTFLDLVTKLMSSGAITALTKVNFDRQTLTVTWRLGNVLQKLGLKLRQNFPNLVFQV